MSAGDLISLVPLQGSYVARRCPVVAQLETDTSLGDSQVPLTEAEQIRVDRGRAFEEQVFDALQNFHGSRAALIEQSSKADQQLATTTALDSDVSIVLGGWLPDDHQSRRTGKPDILIRLDDGWVPVDVKHHAIVSASRAVSGREFQSELSEPWPGAAKRIDGVEPTTHALLDSIQLVHYRRLLETAGLASQSTRAGIIGSDGVLWWCDLAERRWRKRTRSALEIYADEFDFRLRVITRQLERNDDPSIAPLVIPLKKTECSTCSWRQVCGDQMQERDSVSLIDGITWPNALKLTRHGVATRSDLARLDWYTAWVALGDSSSDPNVDLDEVLATCEGLPAETPLRDALGTRKRGRLRRLESIGISDVRGLAGLDRRTAKIASVGIGHLPSLIDQARAAIAGVPFLRRGAEQFKVPRADVEVDVDMENSESGVYLWGVWVDGAVASGFQRGYRPFVSWEPLDPSVEAGVFDDFWRWLIDLRDATIAQGRTFAAYCYSPAENTQMSRIAERLVGGPALAEVHEFIDSDDWIDLLTVVKSRLITGSGFGLKKVAPLAGFHWRDDDPGGDQSMVWYDRAVNDPDPATREANRVRLLAYNEDDVKATAAIRSWLSSTSFPSIADAPPPS